MRRASKRNVYKKEEIICEDPLARLASDTFRMRSFVMIKQNWGERRENSTFGSISINFLKQKKTIFIFFRVGLEKCKHTPIISLFKLQPHFYFFCNEFEIICKISSKVLSPSLHAAAVAKCFIVYIYVNVCTKFKLKRLCNNFFS